MISCQLKDENTVELNMQGEITADDYKKIQPQLKEYFENHGKMKFLIVLDRVKSFTLGAIFQDIKTDLQNFKNIGTTAVVGDRKSQEVITKVADKLYPEKIKYFDDSDFQGANQWLQNAA
jgi:translation initiation factor IF-3